jgi:predicted transport protein
MDYTEKVPSFARDVSKIGHFGTGNLELRITNKHELQASFELARKAYVMTGGD